MESGLCHIKCHMSHFEGDEWHMKQHSKQHMTYKMTHDNWMQIHFMYSSQIHNLTCTQSVASELEYFITLPSIINNNTVRHLTIEWYNVISWVPLSCVIWTVVCCALRAAHDIQNNIPKDIPHLDMMHTITHKILKRQMTKWNDNWFFWGMLSTMTGWQHVISALIVTCNLVSGASYRMCTSLKIPHTTFHLAQSGFRNLPFLY